MQFDFLRRLRLRMELMASFLKFPVEGATIGRLVVGYGELEFFYAVCAGYAISNTDAGLRVSFRLRSETNKIQVGLALMEEPYAAAKLTNELGHATKAMRFCRKVRNQYTHAQWAHSYRSLWFADLEVSAKAESGFPITWTLIRLKLLEQQESYFNYVYKYLDWLRHEYRFKSGKTYSNPFPKPAIQPTPSQHSQRTRDTHPGTDVDLSTLPPEQREGFLRA